MRIVPILAFQLPFLVFWGCPTGATQMDFLKKKGVLEFPKVTTLSKDIGKFIDACTCGRDNKIAVLSIKQELERKDLAIERLQEEIRRKDGEKDNLIAMQRDLQEQILQIRHAIGTNEPARSAANSLLPPPPPRVDALPPAPRADIYAGAGDELRRAESRSEHMTATLLSARARGDRDRNFATAVAEIRELEATHIGISSQRSHPYWETRVPRAALPGFLMNHEVTITLLGDDRAMVEAPAHPHSADHVVEFLYAKDGHGKIVAATRCTPGEIPCKLSFVVPIGVATLTGFLACNKHGVWRSQPVDVPPLLRPSDAAGAKSTAVGLADLGGAAAEQLAGLKGLGGAGAAPPELAYDEESIDSDYNFRLEHFATLGSTICSGQLKLAKVYGQESPPAAEEELEWEVRHFVLHDNQRLVHYDGLHDGVAVGDRGLVCLEGVKAVEKVVGVNTFVMRGENKIHMLKLVPHDEAAMNRWIVALSSQIVPRT